MRVLLGLILLMANTGAVVAADDVHQLVSAMLGETPMISDLQSLTDEVGGRPTGSEANHRAVEWALERFREAGVEAHAESFEMPALWLETRAEARVTGDASYTVRVAAKPFSVTTSESGIKARVVDGGRGTAEDFARLGDSVKGSFVLLETEELEDIEGLFAEYANDAGIEDRAASLGVAGLVYQGSRPGNQLYRHNAFNGPQNRLVTLVMERDGAGRLLRLVRSGREMELWVRLEAETGPAYEAQNVIAEIRGSELPEEIVVVGAHLDSWGLGTGALDNGCNVAMVIDMARQIQRLGIRPKRTLRFALWNGEEQNLNGSLGYVRRHAEELDRHVMASSYDIGSGRISGFFLDGASGLGAVVDRALEPVAGLGPFVNIEAPIVGTDNYDFMMEGISNLVGNQESANYGPNYHSRSDTFERVDQRQLRLNGAVAAAVSWGFANLPLDLPRRSRADLEALIGRTDLRDQMWMMGVWDDWELGQRGRKP